MSITVIIEFMPSPASGKSVKKSILTSCDLSTRIFIFWSCPRANVLSHSQFGRLDSSQQILGYPLSFLSSRTLYRSDLMFSELLNVRNMGHYDTLSVARRFNCRVLPLQLSTTADVWDGLNFTAVQNTAIAQQQPCDCPTDHTRCQTKETRDSRSHSTKAVGQNCQNVCYRLLMTSNNSTKPHTDVARHSQNTVIH